MAKQTRRRKKRRHHRRHKSRHGPTKITATAVQVPTAAEPEKPGPDAAAEPEKPGPDAAAEPEKPGPDAAAAPEKPGPDTAAEPEKPGPDAAAAPAQTAATSDHQPGDPVPDAAAAPAQTATSDHQPGDPETLAPMVLAPVRSVPVEHISLDPGARPRPAPVRTPSRRLPPTLRASTVNHNARRRVTPLVRAFIQGALVGLFVMTPAFAVTLYGLAQLGMGAQQAGLAITLALTAAFAGVPAAVLTGGIGRTTALMAALPVSGSRPRAIRSATFSAAVIGVGLCVLAAVPLRYVPPEQPVRWLWLAGSGAVVGGIGGLALGYWVVLGSRRAPRRRRRS